MALRRALEGSGDEVNVALSRETAELVSRLVDARVRGEEILVSPGNDEITPSEAAVLLGMSRPQVRMLMDRALLEFRKVGTHDRIRVSSIRRFWSRNVHADVRHWPTWPRCRTSSTGGSDTRPRVPGEHPMTGSRPDLAQSRLQGDPHDRHRSTPIVRGCPVA